MGNIIHTIGSLDFTNYEYHQILVDGAATINGESITTNGPITLDIGITNSSQISGAGVLGLIGKKRPELLSNTNTDGTLSIKG